MLLGKGNRDRGLLYRMIEDNRTERFLRKLGYRVVFFPTGYGATARHRLADQVIPSGAQGQPEVQSQFQSVWLMGTALRPALRLGCVMARCPSTAFPFRLGVTRACSLEVQAAGRPAEIESGAQVCLCPPAGSARTLRLQRGLLPEANGVAGGGLSRRGSGDACSLCGAGAMRESPSPAAGGSATPGQCAPAYHPHSGGPRQWALSLRTTTRIGGHHCRAELRDRTHVFAAYHLPGVEAQLYDTISPINAIASVLRAYFGASIPPLEDKTYYSSWGRPYDFTRIP